MTTREDRVRNIKKIEEKLDTKLIVYFLGDRNPISLQIADDSIRPMYDHLRDIGKTQKISLFLYSLGGVMETPWKIVTMVREFCEELSVIVPFKCYSASTLICMGADRIIMTPKAELGPIDPALNFFGPSKPSQLVLPDLGVEDIASYLTFLKTRAGLTDQAALAGAIGTLAEVLTPPLLGRIERLYSHIRLVARKLLALHKPALDELKMNSIVEALTEKTYTHGHGIGWKEAKALGLPVDSVDTETDAMIRDLYLKYEELFKLQSNPDPQFYFLDDRTDEYKEVDALFGCVESAKVLHTYSGTLVMKRTRRFPPQLAINVNLPINLPAGIQSNQISQQVQQFLQGLLQQASTQIQDIVQEEIARQAPVEDINATIVGGMWKLVQ